MKLRFLNVQAIITGLLLIVFFYLYIAINIPNLSVISLDSLKTYPTYSLPLYSLPIIYNEDAISYPTVSTSPSSLKYRLVLLKETMARLSKKYNHLFFADKRIAEIKKWKDNIKIVHTAEVYNPKLLPIFHDSHTNDYTPIYLFSDNYNTIESILSRYVEDLNGHMQMINKIEDRAHKNDLLIELKQHLDSHKSSINSYVSSPSITYQNKMYVLKLFGAIYNYYMDYISDRIPSSDLYNLKYGLGNIVANNDYGLYTAYIHFDGFIPDNLADATLSVNNQKSTLSLADCIRENITNKGTYLKCLHNSVSISHLSTYTLLHLPRTNVIDSGPSVLYSNKNITYIYHIKDNYKNIHIEINKNNSMFNTLKVQVEGTSIKNREKKLLYDESILDTDQFKFSKVITIPVDTYNNLKLKIITEEKSQLNDFNIIATAIYFPEIKLRKVNNLPFFETKLSYMRTDGAYDISLLNASTQMRSNVEKLIDNGWTITRRTYDKFGYYMRLEYVPLIIVKQLTYILSIIFAAQLVLLLTQKRLGYYASQRGIHQLLGLIRYTIRSYGKNMYVSLGKNIHKEVFVVSSGVFYLSVFILNLYNQDIIAICMLFLLQLLSIQYNLHPNILFKISFITVGFSLIAYITGIQALSTYMLLLSLLLLITGTFQTIIHIAIDTTGELNAFTILRSALGNRVLNVFKSLYFKSLKSLNHITATLCHIKTHTSTHINHLKTYQPKVLLSYFIKLSLSLLIFISFYYLAYGMFTFTSTVIHNQIKRYNRALLNPHISSIEPLILYPSMKVIISGSNFGWRHDGKSKIMTSYGGISTDLWTNEKIIFTVPLSWNKGEVKIQVEKPIEFDNKKETGKSNELLIKVIKPYRNWTKDDDLFFEQLKKLRRETLQINGYNPNDFKK